MSLVKPTQFNVVGSYVSKTMASSQPTHAVDMVVVMPAETLQEKDYLDLRYFYKRAYFLAAISATLQKAFGATAQLSYELLNGNPTCPVLAVKPVAETKKKSADEEETEPAIDYAIRIIPCAPEGFFPKTKLRLGATLLRLGRDGETETPTGPTPFYNSTLTAETCFIAYLKVIRQAEKKCAAFKKACILGRIWLQQRGFEGDISKGGFGQFEWGLLLALLLQGGDSKGHAALSGALSATQLFKALIQFLAVTNFAEKPCILGAAQQELDAPSDCPVLFDAARQHNVAFKMSPWSSELLNQQAKRTRSLLNDPAVDQFTPTFILKADLSLHNFDLVSRLNHMGTYEKTKMADPRGTAWHVGSEVYRILKKALADEELGSRARLIHIQTPPSSPWPITEKLRSAKNPTIEVGIVFDPANMSRTVDKGPIAGPTPEEREECEDFRQFWGEKAELRRFEGDSVRETVIWKSTTPYELCEEIMRYILNMHLRIGALEEDLTIFGDDLPQLLSLKPSDATVFNAARKAFNTFERDVRSLEDLPLHVRRLMPICPELRHSSVKLPLLVPSKSGPRPLETVISFEASGKWPESIAAIQRTKIAFLLMIGSLLEKSKEGEVKTWVGLEDAGSDNENLAFLDVVYESGAAFRLRIHSDLEETLLERQSKDKTQEQHIRTQASTLLAMFRRLYTHLPLHTQTISTIVTRFPALSPTIRLLKHWFNTHKLSCHFSDEFLELVALHVFLSPYPWDAPSTANTGFYRALHFLAHWDWRADPLILDTGGDMSKAERVAITTRLEAWRKIDPGMNHTVLFVATPHDPTGLACTALDGHARPAKVAAARMTALAKSACRVVKADGVALDPRRLFVPSLADYDVVLHLNPKVVKGALKTYPADDPAAMETDSPARTSKFKNLDSRTGESPLPLAQHPSDALLRHLNASYAGALAFFRGAPEDGSIGAIWNPQAERKKFRINLAASYKPVVGAGASSGDESDGDEEEEAAEVGLNREAIVAEIARIGGDLIERIDAKGL